MIYALAFTGLFMLSLVVIALGVLRFLRDSYDQVASDRSEFLNRLSEMQQQAELHREKIAAEAIENRERQRQEYEQQINDIAEREQVLRQVDDEWIGSDDSKVDTDRDLAWEMPNVQ